MAQKYILHTLCTMIMEKYPGSIYISGFDEHVLEYQFKELSANRGSGSKEESARVHDNPSI